MAWRHWISLRRPSRRRFRTGLVLLAYMTAVVGLPIPAPLLDRDSRDTALVNRPCTCDILDQCRGTCCCSQQRCCATPGSAADLPAAENSEPSPVPERACCKKSHAVAEANSAGPGSESQATNSCTPV